MDEVSLFSLMCLTPSTNQPWPFQGKLISLSRGAFISVHLSTQTTPSVQAYLLGMDDRPSGFCEQPQCLSTHRCTQAALRRSLSDSGRGQVQDLPPLNMDMDMGIRQGTLRYYLGMDILVESCSAVNRDAIGQDGDQVNGRNITSSEGRTYLPG